MESVHLNKEKIIDSNNTENDTLQPKDAKNTYDFKPMPPTLDVNKEYWRNK